MPDYIKIDFVLEPKSELIKEGWDIGSVGVEIKRTEKRMYGRILSQIFDYQCCEYQISGKTYDTNLSMIFLYPFEKFYGTMASIMMQEGIGVIRNFNTPYEFVMLHGNGMHPILSVSDKHIEYKRPRFGYEFGHK